MVKIVVFIGSPLTYCKPTVLFVKALYTRVEGIGPGRGVWGFVWG